MTGLGQNISSAGRKSAARLAFVHYLRTGRRLPESAFAPAAPETKFNPYHDPRNGQFTFAPGGPRSLSRIVISDRRRAAHAADGQTPAAGRSALDGHGSQLRTPATSGSDGIPSDAQERTPLRLAQNRPPPPRRARSNIESFWDPMTLEQVFPGLRNAPAGAMLAIADRVFDLTGPADEAFAALSRGYSNRLINQIRQVNPSFRYANGDFPTTREGQMNQIRDLRLKRAMEYYKRGEMGPLQVETLRYLQERVDAAYEVGLGKLEAGRLTIRLSPEEALGNSVDLTVRADLKTFYLKLGIIIGRGQQVRVVGREYNTSGSKRTYRVPDARVGRVAFEVTLWHKTVKTDQIVGFFNTDLRPNATVIIRPSQLGPNSIYIITHPKGT